MQILEQRIVLIAIHACARYVCGYKNVLKLYALYGMSSPSQHHFRPKFRPHSVEEARSPLQLRDHAAAGEELGEVVAERLRRVAAAELFHEQHHLPTGGWDSS